MHTTCSLLYGRVSVWGSLTRGSLSRGSLSGGTPWQRPRSPPLWTESQTLWKHYFAATLLRAVKTQLNRRCELTLDNSNKLHVQWQKVSFELNLYFREREGGVGGSWRHIKEVLGSSGSRFVFIEGWLMLLSKLHCNNIPKVQRIFSILIQFDEFANPSLQAL